MYSTHFYLHSYVYITTYTVNTLDMPQHGECGCGRVGEAGWQDFHHLFLLNNKSSSSNVAFTASHFDYLDEAMQG